MKPRCLFVMREEFHPQLFGREEMERLTHVVEVVGPPIDGDQLKAHYGRLADIDLIVSGWGMVELNAELLAQMPRLRALFHAAGTVKFMATDASWARGIRLTNASGQNAIPTAEFAFAEIILSLKRAWHGMRELQQNKVHLQHDPLVPGCFGSTVGLLSLGKIGRLMLRRLATLDVKVVAYDPSVTADEARALGVTLLSQADVFARADVVSCHMPLIPQTRRSLGREHFAAMKRGATFINTARGAIVREEELIAVLRERPDLYAVLDVTADEPPTADSPLYTLPNVVLTPHIAGSVGPECRRLGSMIVSEVERFVDGRPLLGEVRREEMDTLA